MKPLVVISRDNAASANIRDRLLDGWELEAGGDSFWTSDEFDMAEYGGSIIEIEPKHNAEYYVFASTHRSSSGTKSLTVHYPGNWEAAALGGKPRTLNTAMPCRMKAALRRFAELSSELPGWEVCVETDHHGPTLEKPVMFVEIGSTEAEWRNETAGRLAAEAIVAAIRNREEFPAHVGFGGSHYAPKFTPIVLGGEKAMGHMIAGYSIERGGVDEEMVRQALEKNVEKAKTALLDWKGIKGAAREKLIGILESMGMEWEKA